MSADKPALASITGTFRPEMNLLNWLTAETSTALLFEGVTVTTSTGARGVIAGLRCRPLKILRGWTARPRR
jgi:hypothetical protein